VTGPDHLAALLPLCLGRRWYEAASTGAFWGLGHGAGAALVGMLCFSLRGALNLHALAPYMEAAVGASIVVIGATGYREAREWADSAELCEMDLSAASGSGADEGSGAKAKGIVMTHACDEPPPQDVARTLLNGVLNGVSGTGHILGVLPALAMPSWAVAGVYLGCFGLGTLLAMALFTGVVGELSSQGAYGVAPATSAMVASVGALALGSVWTLRALAGLGVVPYVRRAAPAALAAMLRYMAPPLVG